MGIDIASNTHYVAVDKDRCEEPVRSFKRFTWDLHVLAKWLVLLGITSAAMESTGSYWSQLYRILVDYGIDVILVNTYHVKNVPGRKTDVKNTEWLQELNASGYLKPCFRADNITRELRTYVRLRKQIIRDMAKETQHMQKAMVCMNIKQHDVISDIHGKTWSNIITAILEEERDPAKLIKFRNNRIKCSEDTLIKSLEGNWRDEHVFCLTLARNRYKELEAHLRNVDRESERVVKLLVDSDTEEATIKNRPSKNKQEIEFITNQKTWTANTISELYKARWQIEIFFREIKQLQHIKSFVGTSENAVMIQIWTALITMLILKVLKAIGNHPWYLSNLVAFIRLNLFVKIDLKNGLTNFL